MTKWPAWNLITQNAKTFLTDDISQDDPYLLYCALICGINTKIISRDLMRSHVFLLKDQHYKRLFNRWLFQNRCELLHVNEKGNVFIKVNYFYTPMLYFYTVINSFSTPHNLWFQRK